MLKRIILTTNFLFIVLIQASAAQIPSYYDLRDVDGICYVTSVKEQTGGTCWAHGAMAAMEGNLVMTRNWLESGESRWPNLAEYHLDWWNGFNWHNNDDENPITTGLDVHQGGDYRVTSAYLSRGEGAVREIDGQSYDNPPYRDYETFHKFYARHIEFMVAGSDLSNIDAIKQRIMDEGVIGTCMCYSGTFMSGYNHYQPPEDYYDPNHAISIVGWDDDHHTQAPQPGAWICKNSWGADWGYDGYFYISYYDKWCCQHPEMGAVSFRDVEPLKYDKIYYHDYHGWRHTKTGCDEAFNAFAAEDDFILQSVSFFTAADNITYTVKIYDNFLGGALLSELASESGTFEIIGLHTVDLSVPVEIEDGDDFYVYLYLSDGGHPYDATSDVPVLLGADYRTTVVSSANSGESYYYSGSSWIDLTTDDETANFCIKALGVDWPALGIMLLDDPPECRLPGYATTLNLQINDMAHTCLPGTAYLHYSADGLSFMAYPLTLLRDNQFEATLPEAECGDTPEYYFSAQADNGVTVYFPGDSPDSTISEVIGEYEIVFFDDFESDKGWVVSGTATDGIWERGIPVGDGAGGAPHTDYDGSGHCYLTGNSPGYSDVDGGQTILKTPSLDLSGGNAEICYYRWFSNSQGPKPFGDVLYIYVSSNQTNRIWNLVDMAGPSIMSNGGWYKGSFNPGLYIILTDDVQVRIDCGDLGDESTVEGALDNFMVRRLTCTDYLCGDPNGDQVIDILDIVYLIDYKYKGGPEPVNMDMADVDNDSQINILDIVYLINYKYKSGPDPSCSGK